MKPNLNEVYFKKALQLAKRAALKGEVPIGALIVKDGKVLASASNQTERRMNFSAHAEMLCLHKAAKNLRSKYLVGAELFVTLEPCLMCQYAARLCRIRRIHFLASSKTFGSNGSAYHSLDLVPASASELTQEAVGTLQAFFRQKR